MQSQNGSTLLNRCTAVIGQYPFVGGVKTPSAVWNHPQGTPKLTELDYRHQRAETRLWACAIQTCRQSLYCMVGGQPLTTVMTLKTHLQRASLYHYSKKSSPIKSAESMNLIRKSKFQVLSAINQFKNDRFK